MTKTGGKLGGLCFRCGKPAATPARADSAGRILCAACAPAASTRHKPGDEPFILEPEPAGKPREDGTFEIAPRDLSGHSRAPCAKCGSVLLPGQRVCACGYATPEAPGVVKLPKPKQDAGPRLCSKCGYDLKGVVAPVCPECGTPHRLDRTTYLEEVSRDVERSAHIEPIITALVGLALVTVVFLLQWKFVELGIYALIFPVRVALGVGIVALYSWAVEPIDSTLKLTFLRTAAIYAPVDVIMALGGFFVNPGIIIFQFILAFVAFVGLTARQFDMEIGDAKIFAGVTASIHLGVSWLLMMTL